MQSAADRLLLAKTNTFYNDIDMLLISHGQVVNSKDCRALITNTLFKQHYSIPRVHLKRFHEICNAARLANIAVPFAEHQANPSAINIEFIITHSQLQQVEYREISGIINNICKITNELLEGCSRSDPALLNSNNTASSVPTQEISSPVVAEDRKDAVLAVLAAKDMAIAILKRDEMTSLENARQRQVWYRILFPDIHVSKRFKERLLHEFNERKIFSRVLNKEVSPGIKRFDSIVLRDACIIEPINVQYLASDLYKIDKYLEYSVEDEMINPMPEVDIATVNICEQLSILHSPNHIVYSSANDNNSDSAIADASVVADRKSPDGDSLEDIEQKINIFNEVNVDSDIGIIKVALDILPEEYKQDETKWVSVINALANKSVSTININSPDVDNDPFLLLAKWFTYNTPYQLRLGDVWTNPTRTHEMSSRKIMYMAKHIDYERFIIARDNLIVDKIHYYAIRYDGRIEHVMMANILHLLLNDSFISDFGTNIRGKADYCWYEFVNKNTHQGDIYKWRLENEPDELIKYMNKQVDILFGRVIAKLASQLTDFEEKSPEEKAFKRTIGNFKTCQTRLFNQTFISSVTKSALIIFRNRGFVKSLDTNGEIIGVGNGVLLLRNTQIAIENDKEYPRLIQGYHEYPISKFTRIDYYKMDPNDPYVKTMMNALDDIFVEEDAKTYIMCFAAAALDGRMTNPVFLTLHGGGANGKSSVLEFIRMTLDQYAKKLPVGLFTANRESADKPNSALMMLKGTRIGIISETTKSEILNDATLKEVLSQEAISGRDLNSRQENFENNANIISSVNHPMVIKTTDHGTWRRIKMYVCKTRFCEKPDPNNRYEKKVNRDFISKFKSDQRYIQAFLSILVHYYYRLKTEFHGNLDNVDSKTINAETEAYRNRQDMVNCFICSYLEELPAGSADINIQLDDIATSYIEWISMRTQDRHQLSHDDVVMQFTNSKISKNIIRLSQQLLVVRGYKLLTTSEVHKKTAALINNSINNVL